VISRESDDGDLDLLTAPMRDAFGDDPEALLRRDPNLDDPLPSLVPETGMTSLAAIARASVAMPRVDVTLARGSSAAAIAVTLLEATKRPVVVVSQGADESRQMRDDIEFFSSGGEPVSVLVLTPPEVSPYAEVSPDRRGEMARVATLAHLARTTARTIVCVAAPQLVRKVVPRDALRAHTQRVVYGEVLDREALLRALSEAGYLRVPLVEDPGTFAVRGSLVDVWPPVAQGGDFSRDEPVRIELDDELVVGLKRFDPHDQRTSKDADLDELWLPPAREAIFTPANVARAKARILDLADTHDVPTVKARGLADDVATGRAFFGADGYLPTYYASLDDPLGHLPADATVVLDDPEAVVASVRDALFRATEDERACASPIKLPLDAFFTSDAHLAIELEARRIVTVGKTLVRGTEAPGLSAYEVTQEPFAHGSLDLDDLKSAMQRARAAKGKGAGLVPLTRRIAHFREAGLRVLLTARTLTQAERIASLLSHKSITCELHTSPVEVLGAPAPGRGETDVEIVPSPLTRGVILPADGLAVITEEEVFGGRAHKKRERKNKDTTRPFLEDLRSLSVGDLVVHVEHGVGRYLGLVHKPVGGHLVDLLVVEYAGKDKLYLPVYRLNQVQKLSGGEGESTKLDRLGGSTFSKTKARVRKEVRQMADELLRLYAERKAQLGTALAPVDDEYRAFEATFPFEETPDQARAIDDVNRDLEAPRPMDRLVCGDVGFGKTEVAIRAAFRVAMSGRQVCVLCPTTVLAQQHFRTFEARLSGYPITVKCLSRFQSKREQDEILKATKEGKVDVLVGTHRLLSKDLHFKALGLLVVDEEQRFGVTHKERIKQMRSTVDVLTLSATPIPRTLQMAVGGLRDLSLIATPPADRRSVRTIVTRFDPQVLREAVTRELSRGGQVFFVHNRIEGLYERAQRLTELVPNARIAVAHGQLAKTKRRTETGESEAETNLERTMLDFVDGRYDVLCATAIVESGLDIPRANTIIIDRADMFGLSQLYQLRGRVGRSRERAYCYLVVPPQDAMTDDARARVEAIERFSELGSGFKVASLDLELRGAGDLLGGEQSGTVASVGFDLFCQMLEEAVHELRGEEVVFEVDPELSYDVEALVPESYVAEVGVRLSLYKRLAGAVDEAHVDDIADEMENRFGPPPEEVRRLFRLMAQKTHLRRLRVLGCEATSRLVTLHLREDTPLDSRKITELLRDKKSPWKLTPDMRLSRRFEGTASCLDNVDAMLTDLARLEK
jgi:transcription-repair coupling factor (superfamily II helicase)